MKMRCLSILFLSYISFVSNVNAKLNHCSAIDKTDTDLSDVVVLFVKFKWASEIGNMIRIQNYTVAEADLINVLERRRNSVLPEIMENFFECYGGSGGLQVRSVTLEKKLNSTGECVFNQKQDLPNKSEFAGKIVRVIESQNFVENCGENNTRHKKVQELVSESTMAVTLNIALCHNQHFNSGDCKTLKSQGFRVIPVGARTSFYEVLEVYIDNLPSFDSNITVSSDDVDMKYLYFPTVPKQQLIWPSFISVLTVITFFLGGLCFCCCGLLTFALVEEDFQKRNEERDWIALNMRRDEQQDAYVASPALSQDMVTAISNGSNQSGSKIETAKSNISSTKSSSSSDVVTDSTQPTETISGTARTARSKDETEVETANELN